VFLRFITVILTIVTWLSS